MLAKTSNCLFTVIRDIFSVDKISMFFSIFRNWCVDKTPLVNIFKQNVQVSWSSHQNLSVKSVSTDFVIDKLVIWKRAEHWYEKMNLGIMVCIKLPVSASIHLSLLLQCEKIPLHMCTQLTFRQVNMNLYLKSSRLWNALETDNT